MVPDLEVHFLRLSFYALEVTLWQSVQFRRLSRPNRPAVCTGLHSNDPPVSRSRREATRPS